MATNPYNRYKQQSVMTMTHGEMLTMLYDEVIKQLTSAVNNISSKDVQATNNSLQKAQRILNHLKSTLDFKYEVSNSLSPLYDFFIREIISANVKKDPTPLNEIIPIIVELKDTFAQGERLARMGQQTVTSKTV